MPALTSVTVLPLTVQTAVSAEVKVTVSPLVAVAETVKVPVPMVLLASAPNEMVCGPSGVTAVEAELARLEPTAFTACTVKV